MKKLQVMLPEPILKELIDLMKESGYDKESEFGRYIITEWITLKKYGILKSLETFCESKTKPEAI